MKRNWMIAIVVGILAVLAVVSVVSAQGTQPPTTPAPGQGWGMMGRGGMMSAGQGSMHEYMEAALAEKLGMTKEAYEQLFDEGKTFWQIAQDKGLTTEQAQQIMVDARNVALDKMVSDGVITKTQADWMKTRMGSGGMRGAGGCMGGYGNPNRGGASAPRGMMGRTW